MYQAIAKVGLRAILLVVISLLALPSYAQDRYELAEGKKPKKTRNIHYIAADTGLVFHTVPTGYEDYAKERLANYNYTETSASQAYDSEGAYSNFAYGFLFKRWGFELNRASFGDVVYTVNEKYTNSSNVAYSYTDKHTYSLSALNLSLVNNHRLNDTWRGLFRAGFGTYSADIKSDASYNKGTSSSSHPGLVLGIGAEYRGIRTEFVLHNFGLAVAYPGANETKYPIYDRAFVLSIGYRFGF